MSALEYRLLLVFFSNKNQLLSRDRLAEELWALTKEFVSDNTLSVLSAEIHKMTIWLREQNAGLKDEKQFAKEALEDISHQLRTSLTSVMMILGLMQSTDLTENELPHIFERFYRSSEYTKNGFGIGLAFAKKVISAQDGSLKAANHKPYGAMFDIHFYKTTI